MSTFDVFVSYSHRDQSWVWEWLIPRLKAANFAVCTDRESFDVGVPALINMENAVIASRHTLLVLTPAWVESLWTHYEALLAQQRDPAGLLQRTLPVLRQPCEVPGRIAQLSYANLTGERDDEVELSKLLDALHGVRRLPDADGVPIGRATTSTTIQTKVTGSASSPDTLGELHQTVAKHSRFAAPFPPIWNVPYHRNPLFAGRQAILESLHDGFSADETGVVQPQAVSGTGGIGKTHIAIEYAFRYRGDYRAILWINAESREELEAEFVMLANVLDLTKKNEQDQRLIIDAVKHWLRGNSNWLLILDNADNLALAREYIPTAYRGHILLTTKTYATTGLANSIKIAKMEPEEGAWFLLRRGGVISQNARLEDASEPDRENAKALSREVDGLPLALDQAGAYIEETACGLSSYIEIYETYRKELSAQRGDFGFDHPKSVATTWTLAFEEIKKTRAATELLRLCAFLHPDAIAEQIVTKGAPSLGSVLGPVATDPLKLNAAIAELLKFSLIQRNPDTHAIIIHRLTQLTLKEWMGKKAQRQWAERAVRALNYAFPGFESSSWQNCQPYLLHVYNCVALIKKMNMRFIEAAQLLHRTGYYLHKRAQYDQAEPFYQQALAIYEQALGAEHLDVATLLDHYADVLRRMQREDEAVAREKKAQNIRMKQNNEIITTPGQSDGQ